VIRPQLQDAVQSDSVEETLLANGKTANRKPGQKGVPQCG